MIMAKEEDEARFVIMVRKDRAGSNAVAKEQDEARFGTRNVKGGMRGLRCCVWSPVNTAMRRLPDRVSNIVKTALVVIIVMIITSTVIK